MATMTKVALGSDLLRAEEEATVACGCTVLAAPLLVTDGEVVDVGDGEVSHGAMMKSWGRMVSVVSSLSS